MTLCTWFSAKTGPAASVHQLLPVGLHILTDVSQQLVHCSTVMPSAMLFNCTSLVRSAQAVTRLPLCCAMQDLLGRGDAGDRGCQLMKCRPRQWRGDCHRRASMRAGGAGATCGGPSSSLAPDVCLHYASSTGLSWIDSSEPLVLFELDWLTALSQTCGRLTSWQSPAPSERLGSEQMYHHFRPWMTGAVVLCRSRHVTCAWACLHCTARMRVLVNQEGCAAGV